MAILFAIVLGRMLGFALQRVRCFKFLLLIGLLNYLGVAIAEENLESHVAASRSAVKEFKQALQAELKTHMKTGGPVQAIGVCNDRAPEIAASLSEKYDWRIGRTSLKLRNPNNAPDEWEGRVLEQFELEKAKGIDPGALEHYATVESNGRHYFRYMKAIPTNEVCLKCHGDNITPEVAATLNELYPTDQATGFKLGDLRGAFTIVQPLDAASD